MRTIGVGLIGAGYMGKRHTALLRMADGASGTIQVSRCAWGRKGRPQLQLFGARGAIVFDQERFNRVGLFVATRGAMGERGPQERQLTGPTIDCGKSEMSLSLPHERSPHPARLRRPLRRRPPRQRAREIPSLRKSAVTH
jgi:predicted dehydrogenase